MDLTLLISINFGNSDAMNNLGFYNKTINNIDDMKKYYLMSIERENVKAMINYAMYLYETKQYDEMKKYYLILHYLKILKLLKPEEVIKIIMH